MAIEVMRIAVMVTVLSEALKNGENVDLGDELDSTENKSFDQR